MSRPYVFYSPELNELKLRRIPLEFNIAIDRGILWFRIGRFV